MPLRIYFAIRNKWLKKSCQKLKEITRSHFGKYVSLNADEGVAHDFVMVTAVDASGNEDDKQPTLNYLREPLLDDID